MRSITYIANAFRRIGKILLPPSDEELVAAYIEDAGDLIDLEMRMREVARERRPFTGA